MAGLSYLTGGYRPGLVENILFIVWLNILVISFYVRFFFFKVVAYYIESYVKEKLSYIAALIITVCFVLSVKFNSSQLNCWLATAFV